MDATPTLSIERLWAARRALRRGFEAREQLYRPGEMRGTVQRSMAEQAADRPPQAPHASDLALVQRARSGDARATDEVLERLVCVPAMLRDRHRRFGAPLGADELEDVEQDTLAALWSKLELYRGLASLETWAYRFAFNELLKTVDRKRRRTHLRPEAPEATLEELVAPTPLETDDDALDLEVTLARLAPAAADVIRAHHFDELSFEEFALLRGEPLSTVKARYYRGLSELKRLATARRGERT
jgi:RNA polymerase sigma-70 factor (ECF subfamily)